MERKRSQLDQFLEKRRIQVYNRERFVRRSFRKKPLINIDYTVFVDERNRFKKELIPLLWSTIQEADLKIYFVMVSWWGRGDEARWTGSHLFKTLRRFQREGLCDLLLSYQEGNREPSSLCVWCRKNKIDIIYADRHRLLSKADGATVISEKAEGKAENVIKSIKWIEQQTRAEGRPPGKVLVIFVDDDYTQYHWLNYFQMFAPWVLSFARKTGDKTIDDITGRIKKVSFIKSGSPRIILPFEIQEQIVDGRRSPMDYLDLTLAIINLAAIHQRLGFDDGPNEIDRLVTRLQGIKKRGQVYGPKSRHAFLGEELSARMESIWREYIYRGGRVTQRLEAIFHHLSHKAHCRWLRQFTFLLHGDQGAPLDAWLEYSPFGGYALEISLLTQSVCDNAFADRQVLNVVGLPHSHQRSKELAIWHMFDTILLAFDLLRVLYKDMPVRDFLSLYKRQRIFPMLDRYGNVIKHTPEYGELKIYPPLKDLEIR